MLFPTHFDVIVVGGGHAGTEAALASARMGHIAIGLDGSERFAQMAREDSGCEVWQQDCRPWTQIRWV